MSSPASGEIKLTVQPGKDNGQVLLGYLLTKYPGGKSEYVSSPGGTTTTLSMYGTNDGAPGQWTARAVNQVGTSPESAKTSVHVIAPTVAITSPAPGATVPGPNFAVAVKRVARPDRQGGHHVRAGLRGGCMVNVDETAPYAFTVSASSGATTLRATPSTGRVDAPRSTSPSRSSTPRRRCSSPPRRQARRSPQVSRSPSLPRPRRTRCRDHQCSTSPSNARFRGNVADFAEAYGAPFTVR